MHKSVNIIIPAIELNDELLKCLKEINNINYSNFFVTIVLDNNFKTKLPKFKYKMNKLIVGKINMSKKRNIAVKKYKSEYIAFIDSDAYPNKNWLKLGTKYLKQKKADIVGGPSILFPNQNYFQKVCNLSLRSYFVTGYQNYRKYKAKKRYCDWLECCNLIMRKKFYLKHGGMDSKIYTGEDREFFERTRKNNRSLKVLYSPDLFIYHKQRGLIGFLLQRFSFGTDIFNLINISNSGLRRLQPLLPVLILFSLLFILLLNIETFFKINTILIFLMFTNLVILVEIKRYIKSVKTLLLTLITINLANVAWALGGVITLIGLRKFLLYKTFSHSHLDY